MATTITGVSGTVSDGLSITITDTGNSFGTKATATPLMWDTFEGGVSGASIVDNTPGTAGTLTWQVGSTSPRYSTLHPHAGSQSVEIRTPPLVAYMESLFLEGVTFARGYLDYRCYLDYVTTMSDNWKTWMFESGSYTRGINEVYQPGGGTVAWEVGPVNYMVANHASDTVADNTSFHFQVEMIDSGAGTYDGTLRQWTNVNQSTYSLWCNATNQRFRTISATLGHVTLGELWQPTGNSGAYVYLDNVYVDNSLARVEIGNASTYGACTHREIQIPATWDVGSITATVNQGTFANGNTGYVYVIPSTGYVDVNTSGYQVTFGSGTPPTGTPVLSVR